MKPNERELYEDKIRDLNRRNLETVARYESELASVRHELEEANTRCDFLMGELDSIKKALNLKNEEEEKVKNQLRGLGKLLQKKSERQNAEKESPGRKRRPVKKRLTFSRKEFYCTVTEEKDVFPRDESFDMEKARLIRIQDVVRYDFIPGHFVKTIYHLHHYSLNGDGYAAKAPRAMLKNSNFSPSVLAIVLQLRYVYSMTVDRICKYFAEIGFDIDSATIDSLLRKTAGHLDKLYRVLRDTVLSNPYLNIDETYHKVLLKELEKGSKNGYLWEIIARSSGLVYFFYEDGSRQEEVILKTLEFYKGLIQSDCYSAYKKLESDLYPDITRIACWQHCKRYFLDCRGDKDANAIIGLCSTLSHLDKKHRVGEKGWTAEDHLKYRRKYAPPILQNIKYRLTSIRNRRDYLPKSLIRTATEHMLTEWDALCAVFNYGYTTMDNNICEIYNRYISLSRRNSLFFGSHKGAERGAMYYSFASSCRMNGLNTFEYFCDILTKIVNLEENAPIEKYRELLPDMWKKA